MENKTKDILIASVSIMAAYFFLFIIWIIFREFSYTYTHWMGDANLLDLPVLTAYALPITGFENVSSVSAWISSFVWLFLAACPTAFFIFFFRSSRENRISVLSLSLVAWLFTLLSLTALTVFGLWLPFSFL